MEYDSFLKKVKDSLVDISSSNFTEFIETSEFEFDNLNDSLSKLDDLSSVWNDDVRQKACNITLEVKNGFTECKNFITGVITPVASNVDVIVSDLKSYIKAVDEYNTAYDAFNNINLGDYPNIEKYPDPDDLKKAKDDWSKKRKDKEAKKKTVEDCYKTVTESRDKCYKDYNDINSTLGANMTIIAPPITIDKMEVEDEPEEEPITEGIFGNAQKKINDAFENAAAIIEQGNHIGENVVPKEGETEEQDEETTPANPSISDDEVSVLAASASLGGAMVANGNNISTDDDTVVPAGATDVDTPQENVNIKDKVKESINAAGNAFKNAFLESAKRLKEQEESKIAQQEQVDPNVQNQENVEPETPANPDKDPNNQQDNSPEVQAKEPIEQNKKTPVVPKDGYHVVEQDDIKNINGQKIYDKDGKEYTAYVTGDNVLLYEDNGVSARSLPRSELANGKEYTIKNDIANDNQSSNPGNATDPKTPTNQEPNPADNGTGGSGDGESSSPNTPKKPVKKPVADIVKENDGNGRPSSQNPSKLVPDNGTGGSGDGESSSPNTPKTPVKNPVADKVKENDGNGKVLTKSSNKEYRKIEQGDLPTLNGKTVYDENGNPVTAYVDGNNVLLYKDGERLPYDEMSPTELVVNQDYYMLDSDSQTNQKLPNPSPTPNSTNSNSVTPSPSPEPPIPNNTKIESNGTTSPNKLTNTTKSLKPEATPSPTPAPNPTPAPASPQETPKPNPNQEVRYSANQQKVLDTLGNMKDGAVIEATNNNGEKYTVTKVGYNLYEVKDSNNNILGQDNNARECLEDFGLTKTNSVQTNSAPVTNNAPASNQSTTQTSTQQTTSKKTITFDDLVDHYNVMCSMPYTKEGRQEAFINYLHNTCGLSYYDSYRIYKDVLVQSQK